ncbi:DNA-binding response regulator [Halomicronema hongdechloris C2206]|uniref:DNA-binding response regulator n=1 Tax=Halomicronema hongdechloris C2206 TaxID=1641165 RepID=A0A1Z3HQG9_9CYAN|nr:response regulator [Halomicronema hongdechloris]ASC72560.1 DNA-binding response regulator [Halomicronema hongdechloris C2206]
MAGRILIIEDNDANRLFLTDYLEYCGYRVMGLYTGINLLTHLQAFQPQLILLNLKLPDIDGYTLLKQLQDTPWRDVPVIVLSGYAFATDQQRALALGARYYLVKPTHLQTLTQIVRRFLPPDDDSSEDPRP